jgi:hypothetical protein
VYVNSLHTQEDDGETPFSLIWRSIRARSDIGEAIEAFTSIDIPPRLIASPAAFAALIGEISLYARMLETCCLSFGSPTASPWRMLSFGERARLSIISGFFEELAIARKHAYAVSNLVQQTADIGVTSLSELQQLIALEKSLPSTAPHVDLLTCVSQLEIEDVEGLIALKVTLDRSVERSKPLPDLSALPEGHLRLIVNLHQLAGEADHLSDRTPESAKTWARGQIDDYATLNEVLEGFLAVADVLQLVRPIPTNAMEALYVAIIVGTSLTKENIAWFRWTPPGGVDAFTAVHAEWSSLTQAERRWRSKYSSYGDKQWPMPEELTTVADLVSKGGISKIISKFAGNSKIIASLAEKLGYPPGVVPEPADLRKLASHTQACSAFLFNLDHKNTLDPWWKGFETPFEQIARMVAFRQKVRELLVARPHGREVFERIVQLDSGSCKDLSNAQTAAEKFKSLDSSLRQQLHEVHIEVSLTNVRASAALAHRILRLDPEDILLSFKQPIATLLRAAEVEFCRRKAEIDFWKHPLASTNQHLNPNRSSPGSAGEAAKV